MQAVQLPTAFTTAAALPPVPLAHTLPYQTASTPARPATNGAPNALAPALTVPLAFLEVFSSTTNATQPAHRGLSVTVATVRPV